MPRFDGPVNPKLVASLGNQPLATWWALTAMIDGLTSLPSFTRVQLRTQRAILERAHPELREDVHVAQYLAEEDGDAVQDEGP